MTNGLNLDTSSRPFALIKLFTQECRARHPGLEPGSASPIGCLGQYPAPVSAEENARALYWTNVPFEASVIEVIKGINNEQCLGRIRAVTQPKYPGGMQREPLEMQS